MNYSPVGRSAAEYAAAHDQTERLGLLIQLLKIDPNLAIELADRKGWWSNLDRAIHGFSLNEDAAFYLAQSLSSTAPTFENLFRAIAAAIPSRVSFLLTQGTYDSSLERAWSTLEREFTRLDYEEAMVLIKSLLLRRTISPDRAVELVDLANQNAEKHSRFDYSYSFYDLLPNLLQLLSASEAKRFFKRHVSRSAILDSSSSFGESESNDTIVSAGENLYRCATIITEKLSLTGAIAWSLRFLTEAHVGDQASYGLAFKGAEVAGHGHAQMGSAYFYEDNGWLIEVVVPLIARHLDSLTLEQHTRLLQNQRLEPSALHSTYRLRALILATPRLRLAGLSEELVGLCDYPTGIPSMSDAVARRGLEEPMLARRYLEWVWMRNGLLHQPDESRMLHDLLFSAQHGTFARELAVDLVRNKDFARVELFQLGFFDQLDWASRDREFALRLMVNAIQSGYKPDQFDAREFVRILREVVTDADLAAEVLTKPELREYMAYVVDASPAVDRTRLSQIFSESDKNGKIDLLRRAEQMEFHVVKPIIQLGVMDPDPSPRSSLEVQYRNSDISAISGVRVTAYWSLLQQLQKHGIDVYRTLEIDILDVLSKEKGAYAAHHALILIHVILNCAASAKDYDLGLRAIHTAVSLLSINDRRIDEDVAKFIIWWWSKVPNDYKELVSTRLPYTEAYFRHLMLRATQSDDVHAVEELVRLFKDSPAKLLSWFAWFLWRSMDRELDKPVSLGAANVQSIIDGLIEPPESHRYATLARLLMTHQEDAPNFATSRMLRIAAAALASGTQFYVPYETDMILGSNESELVELLEGLGHCEPRSAASILDFALRLLKQVKDFRLTKRIMTALTSLPSSPIVDRRRQEWLDSIAN